MTEGSKEFDRLIAGYHRFHEYDWGRQRARWAELAESQSPKTLVIACSDSRVAEPAIAFEQRVEIGHGDAVRRRGKGWQVAAGIAICAQ